MGGAWRGWAERTGRPQEGWPASPAPELLSLHIITGTLLLFERLPVLWQQNGVSWS